MKRYVIQIFILFFFFLIVLNLNHSGLKAIDDFDAAYQEKPAIFNADTAWVDSVFESLSLDEKIAQLIMVDGYSREGQENLDKLKNLVEKYNVGGVIFFKGGPVKQAIMTNALQEVAKTPLLISMDAEWGVGWRLDSAISYPRQMMLGAIQDEALIYQMGYDIGEQLKRLGVHINFAPVVDINNNQANPVINSRSFGEDRMNVSRKALMYAQGMQDAGVIAVFKHFPGHGDTNMDSHHELPVIPHDFDRLDSLELFPFKFGIERGISAIMTAHLHIPALDTIPDIASSLSERIIKGFLKNTLGFEGLVFTDALGMKGVSSFNRPGDLEARAFAAGNDILLMPSDVPRAIHTIKREIKKGNLSESQLDESVRKILFAKAWAGLSGKVLVNTDSLYEDINDPYYKVEKTKLIRNSLTLLKNRGGVIPFRYPEAYRMASLTIGTGRPDEFSKMLGNYLELDSYYADNESVLVGREELYTKIEDYNSLIVSIQETSQWPGRNYGIYPQTVEFLNDLQFEGNLVLVIFGNPYSLHRLGNLEKFDAIVLAYEDNPEIHYYAAQGLFGAFEMNGRLPVSVNSTWELFQGLPSPAIERLSYGFPEESGVNSDKLKKIDSLVTEAINMKATPGCQVLVAKDGRVIMNKSYGWQSYQRKKNISNKDLYDLASVTKITATLPVLMKLEAEGRFSTEDSLGHYLPMSDTCNKNGLLIKDILTHQSGLRAWIPFYYKTIEPLDTSEELVSRNFTYEYPYKIGPKAYANRNIVFKDSVYSDSFSNDYPIAVARNIYLRKDYRDTVYNSIYASELEGMEYRYSDLGYYLFQQVIEDLTDTLLYPYVWYNFYSKLGAGRLGYLPLNRFQPAEIVPTENDLVFRKQLLRGHVHDPGAAMLGGVAGHAGLFSNANDLAKMMQMYLNGGSYGGRQFLKQEILDKYTRRVYSENGNRRALGFDKPEPDDKKIGPTSKSATLSSYGHTGFTGTMAWIDPEYQLIYIFLSNRIHPNQYNTLLITGDVRTKIQEAIYEAMEGGGEIRD
jgi:beta-glucosidase-like glycosyl hydrolase/CubicO group peptidase (beta-lactamase class C family)